MAYSKFTISERLLAKVEIIPWSGCWIWMGALQGNRYGQIRYFGDLIYAHRASYLSFVGQIPHGLSVCHKCDVECCINPTHLFLGTHKENMLDMAVKGRCNPIRIKGENHQSAILTEQDVIDVMRLSAEGMSCAKIASAKGVSKGCISNIVTGRNWAHLTGLPPTRKPAPKTMLPATLYVTV